MSASQPTAVRTAPDVTLRALLGIGELRRDPLSFLADVRERYGTIVRVRLPRLSVWVISDPEAIRTILTQTHHGFEKGFGRAPGDSPAALPLVRVLGRGLLTSDAETHRSQRRLIQPMFHHDRIAGYGRVFGSLASEHTGDWRTGDIVSIHPAMTELTMAIIARTVFDVKIDSGVITTIRAALAENQNTTRRTMFWWGRLLNRLPVASTRRWNSAFAQVDAVIDDLIGQRRASSTPRADLISLLLDARDPDTRSALPDQQIRDEVLTLLLAGHETTASALAWAFHLLAVHPDVQDLLRAELVTVLSDRPATSADLPLLPYTRAVVNETLRLYPPAWLLMRRSTADADLAGFRLPAGATVFAPIWLVHRAPELWTEPDAFRPGRWLTGHEPAHRYAYVPFGGGPRQCIGNDFAITEMSLVLATMIRRWRFDRPPGTAPVEPLPLITMRPRGPVPLIVHTV